MSVDLQKANISKRIAAALLDFILLTILVTGAALLLSTVLDYDTHAAIMEERQNHFEQAFGVDFDISAEDYEALSEEQHKLYDEAYKAFVSDEAFLKAYNMQINLILIVITFSMLIAVLVVEFFIPLFFGNGQTIGKKIFGLAVVRSDGVIVSNMQLFIRAVLGKFTVGLMIPIYIIIMLFFGTASIFDLTILAICVLGQLGCVIATRNRSGIHDLLAHTVVVDFASQTIFRSTEELLEYTKKIYADRANRSDYK